MHGLMDVRVALAIALLFLTTVPGAANAMESATSDTCLNAVSGSESDLADISAVVTISPNQSNAVRISYDLRSRDEQFAVKIPSDVDVIEVQGFVYDESEHVYRYSSGDIPYVEYRIVVQGERRQYASQDGWVFAPTPTHINTAVNLQPRPAGFIGDQFLYLGNHTRYSTTLGCHEIRLVVSDSSRLLTSPDQILTSLGQTASQLDVGHRYDEVTIFVTPGAVQPPNRGFANENEAWVTSSAKWDSSEQFTRAVLHEYVHTRQKFGRAAFQEMAWFHEGMAEYYSYKMLVTQGLLAPEQYNRWLQNGSAMSGELTEPASWEDSYVPYGRGGAFLAILDAKIRADSNETLATVILQINSQGDPGINVLIQKRTFLRHVANVSNESTVEWANSSLSTTDTFEHREAVEPSKAAAEEGSLETAIRRRIEAEPFVAVTIAFALGMAVMMPLEGISRWNDSED